MTETIPTDVDKPPEIKWKIREYIGTEVYRTQQDFDEGKPMIDPPAVGEEIIVPTPTGWAWATYRGDRADTDNYTWRLEFDKDDRHCWVAAGCINKKCLEKMKECRTYDPK
jgi:hypothetical protein